MITYTTQNKQPQLSPQDMEEGRAAALEHEVRQHEQTRGERAHLQQELDRAHAAQRAAEAEAIGLRIQLEHARGEGASARQQQRAPPSPLRALQAPASPPRHPMPSVLSGACCA